MTDFIAMKVEIETDSIKSFTDKKTVKNYNIWVKAKVWKKVDWKNNYTTTLITCPQDFNPIQSIDKNVLHVLSMIKCKYLVTCFSGFSGSEKVWVSWE